MDGRPSRQQQRIFKWARSMPRTIHERLWQGAMQWSEPEFNGVGHLFAIEPSDLNR